MISRVSWLAFFTTVLVTILCLRSCSLFADPNSGFELPNTAIPKQLILPFDLEREAIPSIDSFRLENAGVVDWLEDKDCSLSSVGV